MRLEYGEYESILGDTFGIWSCPFWSTFLQILSAADTHLKLLDRVVSGARFLTGSVVKCDVAHHWSVAVLSMLYKIRCNPMHPLYSTLPLQYVSARFACGACFAHRYIVYLCASSQQNIGIQYTYAPPRSRTSGYSILIRVLAAEHRYIVYLCASSQQNIGIQYTYAPPRCRTSQYLSVSMEQSCWPFIRWCGAGGFQEANAFLLS